MHQLRRSHSAYQHDASLCDVLGLAPLVLGASDRVAGTPGGVAMSRGLSQQQRLILGLAAAMSRHHYGAPRAHVPQRDPDWRIPVAFTATMPDVTTALATHIVHGVTIEHYKYSDVRTCTNGAFTLTSGTRSAKNSTSRAITTLMDRGLLVYRGRRRSEDRRMVETGYLLTPAGLESGARHEIELPPDIEYRLVALDWLLVRDRIGCGSWGYDASIPLTFKHPSLMQRVSVGDVPGVEPRQQINDAEVSCLRDSNFEPESVGGAQIAHPPTVSAARITSQMTGGLR